MFVSKYAKIIDVGTKCYIYNALLGGAVSFSSNIKNYLTVEDNNITAISNQLPEDFVSLLMEKHVIFEAEQDENILIDEKIERLNSDAKDGKLIQSIRLTLTKKCNCCCEYCYVDRHSKQSLTLEDCIDFIKKVVSLACKDEYTIRFFGGEPTIEFNIIKQVVAFCKDNYPNINFSYLLNTNAQYITDEMREYLKENKFKTVISLDSVKEINDSQRKSLINDSYYDEAINQIKKFVEDDMPFVVGAVITNKNINALPEFLQTMKELNVKSVGLNHAKMVDEECAKLNKDFAEKIISAYKFGVENNIYVSGYWFLPFKRLMQGAHAGFCGGLGYELDLRPDKKVYSCVGHAIPIGNFEDVEHITGKASYLNIANRVPPNIEGCKGCELEGVCAGECACDAQYHTGDFYGVNKDICNFNKYITKSLLKLTLEE